MDEMHFPQQSQLIQPGVRYESFPLFSSLMGSINGVLQHGIKDIKYNQSLVVAQLSQIQPIKPINAENLRLGASKSYFRHIRHS